MIATTTNDKQCKVFGKIIGINEKILSLDYKNYKAEIKTADAQKSYGEGVTVLVTGCLTGNDNLRRKFAQSFFLAPQDNGYFVLNDVFRYVEDDDPLEKLPVNNVDNAIQAPIPEPDASPVPASAPDPVTLADEDQKFTEKATDASGCEIQIEKEPVVEPQPLSNGIDMSVAVESTSAAVQEDAPKKSYASIVKVAKGSSGHTKVYVPTNTSEVLPKKTDDHPVMPAASAPEPEESAVSIIDAPESINTHEEVEGYSIYIRNLPFNTSASQLEMEFKKFGPIKKDGIQVRNNKQQGYCFGFVEFLSLSSMDDAIKASPITILGRQAVIEAKRTTTRVDVERGSRYSPGRGGFQNEYFRSRGNYGGGVRNFGRNEYRSRGEFSGRGRGPIRRGDGYQQGRGRGGRSGGPRQNTA
ncbi:putative G3BP-like protein isoform X2 [Carica papaya]|uniref:putative G3BP-like protein isoform X2 n=1 Tax=Carica papaya TaxID=3649 RepID=UPI000B8C6EBF|nr:putative G3BP-like protein isoform X2 [Carica papaya]XP_021905245.1 putative G3BP-like protein isoform X2 [Carica papaya]